MTTDSSRRWWALMAMVPASLVVGIDSTVLGLALPTLATSLRASTSQLQWFVSAYMLVFAAVMVPAGLLADRYGRRRLLLIALVILGVGSVACAYASTSGQFMAARILLGVGAAMVIPAALGTLPSLFSDEERPKAVAAVMAATMIGQPIGPLLGGWLLTTFWWGSVFLINIPVVLVALAAAAAFVPESRSERRPRFDVPGIVASSSGLAFITYGVIHAGQTTWTDPLALGVMAAGALALVAFVLWERKAAEPLVDLRLFRSAGFTWGTALATLVSFSMMGLLFATPLYFQEVLGIDAFGNGLRQLPLIAGLLLGVAIATRASRRLGARGAIALGFAVIACGLALGGRTGLTDGSVYAMAWLTVAGAGLGIALPAAMNAALGALSPEHGGVGSGLIQALRMVGGAFGAAILGSVLNASYRGALDLGGLPAQAAIAVEDSVAAGVAIADRLGSPDLLESVQVAFIHGMDVAYLVCAAAAVAGAGLALAFMPRRGATEEQPDVRTPPAGETDATLSPPAGGHEVESGHGALVADTSD
jgi:MFS transporter, DHA2 family, multidrug resistance protein